MWTNIAPRQSASKTTTTTTTTTMTSTTTTTTTTTTSVAILAQVAMFVRIPIDSSCQPVGGIGVCGLLTRCWVVHYVPPWSSWFGLCKETDLTVPILQLCVAVLVQSSMVVKHFDSMAQTVVSVFLREDAAATARCCVDSRSCGSAPCRGHSCDPSGGLCLFFQYLAATVGVATLAAVLFVATFPILSKGHSWFAGYDSTLLRDRYPCFWFLCRKSVHVPQVSQVFGRMAVALGAALNPIFVQFDAGAAAAFFGAPVGLLILVDMYALSVVCGVSVQVWFFGFFSRASH